MRKKFRNRQEKLIDQLRRRTGVKSESECAKALDLRCQNLTLAEEYLNRKGFVTVMSDSERYPLWYKLQKVKGVADFGT